MKNNQYSLSSEPIGRDVPIDDPKVGDGTYSSVDSGEGIESREGSSIT